MTQNLLQEAEVRQQLAVLRKAEFDWAMRLSDVWNDSAWDVPDLHADLRREFLDELEPMTEEGSNVSPLGWVINGSGGSGKTHLLGVFRREAARRNAAFVLVDMTDVRDFWETVLQGYIGSLQVPYDGDLFQHQCILRSLIARNGDRQPAGEVLAMLADRKLENLVGDVKKLLGALYKTYPKQIAEHQNTIRALACLNSADFTIASTGMTWLQGQPLDPADQKALGFTAERDHPSRIVAALSWIMSLCGPTVLAFDQLDPIVTQLSYRKVAEDEADEEGKARSIIAEIGGGLGALHDTLRRTMVIVSCLESTWDTIRKTVLATSVDRFEFPRELKAVGTDTIAEGVVRGRMSVAYRAVGYAPPYETWPFKTEAFRELTASTPREVLKKCEQHRQECIRAATPRELGTFNKDKIIRVSPIIQFDRVTRRFTEAKAAADPRHLAEERHEDERLAPVLQSALQCLIWEREHERPDQIDAEIDVEFAGGTTTRPLHARLRLIFHAEKGREEHYCVRALQYKNPSAYKSRLKAAMVHAGIDRDLKFRHLAVVRTEPLPGGAVTQKLTEQYETAGGLFIKPTDDDLRTLAAIHQLKQEGDPDFREWLRDRRPLSKLDFIREVVPSPLLLGQDSDGSEGHVPNAPANGTRVTQEANGQGNSLQAASEVEESAASSAREADVDPEPKRTSTNPQSPGTKGVVPGGANGKAATDSQDLPIGWRVVGQGTGEPILMSVKGLEKHAVVLAGAGSGKTVLLRRLIEEAALRGIPSIVIDCANDLAALDERWPAPPESWNPGDDARADRYHEQTEVVIWTPGKESGNPMAFEPLPDLAAVADAPDELASAVAMASAALEPFIGAGKGIKAQNKKGILSSSLKFFAKQGGGRLSEYIDLLIDLPADAGLNLNNEAKLAKEISDALKVAIETNPLLGSRATPLDPAVLFGDDRPSESTRISVINLVGLIDIEAQRHFLNQLAMTLFSWIKRYPDPGARPLRGLLVIDEAKDFVPSVKASACKVSLLRLVAQARKYHLGIVFATQNPKDIDHAIIANCSTHFYGKVNSPAAIDVVKEQIGLKGGGGDDVARLPRGRFYVHNADLGLKAPAKVAMPICLSRHPDNPLDEARIMEKAAVSRKRLGR